ncbi:porphobilinogen synthase [Candidatus Deianiraea vastatrix]|uniref:Delta-aminolevulinic acid dehydratase n=1 Tax=Candidatus Deianiraea vastatrix TaxID=2163644 RepID=A0A5B8XCU8_9RICK|nr:porphobilinogen synthase [Candidatus Deianiraea vastatrix]QED23133.1 Delta-aminolevulinic acid dehydratase [Candidatus Deianiraea vastatrix]
MFNLPRNRIMRKNAAIRDLVSDVNLLPSDLIYPIFICENDENAIEIPLMKGVFRRNVKQAIDDISLAKSIGVRSFMLFPYIQTEKKDEKGTAALDKNNIMCIAIEKIKNAHPDAILIADVALDPYTNHGHDGILTSDGKNIDNDATLEILGIQALNQAKCGADFISPSDMMDCRVAKIRNTLDENDLKYTGIISYSAKFASKLYCPFRSAVNSQIKSGPSDKLSYQIDPRCKKSPIKSIIDDEKQGADAVIVKPASLYLDIIKEASQIINLPIFAYQVSGEYSMIKNFSDDEKIVKDLALESLICIKRAGANAIISYFALDLFR